MADTFNISQAFVSYSRRNKLFVQRLEKALNDHGLEVWVDWEDIPPSADWWREIQAGIAAADNFIFIISPESVTSEVCAREIEYGVETHKRFIPVLLKEVTDPTHQALIPPAINTPNWIFFREQDDFDAAVDTLVETIQTDLQHVQAHTRFLVKAREWDSHQRDNSYLLRGTEVQLAENWLIHAEEERPAPSELHRTYILESRRAQNARQRTQLISALVALVVSVVLLVFAVVQTLNLDERNEELAEQITISEANLRRARNTQSLFLTTLSDQELAQGNGQSALLLALESMRFINNGIYHIQSYEALTAAILSPVQEVAVLRQNGQAMTVTGWDTSGTRLLTSGDDGTARLWGADGALIQTFRHAAEGVSVQAGWSADNLRVYTWGGDEATIWSIEGVELARLNHEGDQVTRVTWRSDGNRIMTIALPTADCTDECTYILRVWNADGTLRGIYDTARARTVPEVSWNEDWSRAVVTGTSGFVVLDDALEPVSSHSGAIGSGTDWNAAGDRYITQPTFTTAASLWGTDGNVLAELSGARSARDVTFSPDSRFSLAWSGEIVSFWDMSGETTFTTPPPEGTRFASVFWLPGEAAEAALLARDASCASGDVCTFTLQMVSPNGEDVTTITFESELGAASVTPNPAGGQILVNACSAVRLFNLRGDLMQTIPIPTGQPTTCVGVWSDTGEHLYVQWGPVVSLWRADGAPVDTLEHPFLASDTRWVADGTLIAVTSPTAETQIWDTNGDRVLNFDYGVAAQPLAFNDSHTHVAVPTAQGVVHLWRMVDTTEPTLDLTVWDGLVWSEDRSLVLTWRDDTLYLWQTDGTRLGTLNDGLPIADAVFSDDNSEVLFVDNSPTNCETDCSYRARVWDTTTGAVTASYEHTVPLAEADWNADDTRIIVETARRPNCRNVCNTKLVLLDDAGAPLIDQPIDHTSTEDAQIYEDRFIVAVARSGTNNISTIYDTAGTPLAQITDANPVRSLQFTESDDFAVTATGVTRSLVQLWRIQPDAWELVATLSAGDPINTSGDVSLLSGDRIMTIDNASTGCDICDSDVIVWDTLGQALLRLEHTDRISGAVYSQTSERILSYTSDGLLTIWDAATGENLIQIPHETAIDSAQWSPDGTQILTLTDDDRLVLWQASGEMVFVASLPEGIISASFSTSGQYIAAWSWDKTIHIWDNTGDIQSVLASQEIVSGVWSEESDVLFTSADSGELRLYAVDGLELAAMHLSEEPTQFFLTEDGAHVITNGSDFGQRWLVDLPQLLALGQQLAVRDLNEGERQQFFLFDGQ
ncbi:toll/interleukin-1 receptor domain-containing protein [Phototrophicus methaneseepsis]|uniref:Toll/interleukin-1 receptor domain-containing protein n=1 Tax=Phototrophicus methaneseepsis TaxID=2710758 RepID=A0A7S8EAB8_9CHLR|nr:toll/interleukin-1 receptor domain-containing protein [Phototrophicus methaneseepsis]QPC83313.1 toll/interleukin-1 receptor domain-containing protein [Phototrophicus methaneseepsis]